MLWPLICTSLERRCVCVCVLSLVWVQFHLNLDDWLDDFLMTPPAL